MKYLYHYTSLETLALILRNKTICFNNLLYVDDLDEAETEDMGKFGKFVYVSSAGLKIQRNLYLCGIYIHRICMALEYECLNFRLKNIDLKKENIFYLKM